jgi:hypothetical protein
MCEESGTSQLKHMQILMARRTTVDCFYVDPFAILLEIRARMDFPYKPGSTYKYLWKEII